MRLTTSPERRAAALKICPFGAIEEHAGQLGISAGCRMCRACIKAFPELFQFREKAAPAVDKSQWRGIAVAAELTKRKATMTAQTLVLLLNEVDKFRRDNWLYSPERRGPCSSVRGAWNAYASAGKQIEADWLAKAFTKLDGNHAWK